MLAVMREEGRQKSNSGARDVTARISISLNSQQLPHFVGAKRPDLRLFRQKQLELGQTFENICCLDTHLRKPTQRHPTQTLGTNRAFDTAPFLGYYIVICTWCVYPPCTDNFLAVLVHLFIAAVHFITNCATSTTGRDLTHSRTRLCYLLPRSGLVV